VSNLTSWVQEGGRESLLVRLRDLARVRRNFIAKNPDWPEGASSILITGVLNPDLKKYEGQTIAEVAQDEGKDPLDAVMDIVLADRANTMRVTFGMSEEDFRAALKHPLVPYAPARPLQPRNDPGRTPWTAALRPRLPLRRQEGPLMPKAASFS
jgi:N-acyl-D-aspartate/D-glutamate deacylase